MNSVVFDPVYPTDEISINVSLLLATVGALVATVACLVVAIQRWRSRRHRIN